MITIRWDSNMFKTTAKLIATIGVMICADAVGDKLLQGKKPLSFILGKMAISLLTGTAVTAAMNAVDSVVEEVQDTVELAREAFRKAGETTQEDAQKN